MSKPKFDPRTPVGRLLADINKWKTGARTKGKEYPAYAALNIEIVMAALKHVLDKSDMGLLHDGTAWRMYDREDMRIWAACEDIDAISLLVEMWHAMTKLRMTESCARQLLATLAVTPEMRCTDWNLPLQAHAFVTLAGDGTLVMIDAKGKLSTRAATRDDRLTPEDCAPIATPWIPDASCPVTDATLAAILARPDPVERAALVETYWAAASQMILRGPRSRLLRRAVVFWGEAFSGKSILLKVLHAVLDGHLDNGRRSLVCPTKLEDFDKPFGLANMPGCHIWAVDETTEGYQLKDVATFKQLMDDAAVTVNAKHQQQQVKRLHLPIFIATNSPPAWLDTSKGTSSRVLMINTPMTFVPATDFDPTIPGTALLRPDDELYADLVNESAGILQKLAAAAQAMLRAGAMPVSKEAQATSDTKFTEDDRLVEFVSQAIMVAPTLDHWVINNTVMRALRGMVYDTGGGEGEARSQTSYAMRRRLFNRIRLMFKSETKTAWPDGRGPNKKSYDAQHGVHLTAQGIEWLARAMQKDDGRNQPLSACLLVAERANGPVGGVPLNAPTGHTETPHTGSGNVVAMPSRKPRD